MIRASLRFLVLSAVLATANAAFGGVVTFENFSSGAFSSGTEDGFTIAGSHVSLYTGFSLTSRAAGVASPSTTATLSFSNGGLFTFESFDTGMIVNPGTLATPVIVTGYLGGNVVGTDSYTLPVSANYSAASLSGVALDKLVIAITSNSINSPYVDNVTFADSAATPEPGTTALIGSGLAACLFLRKRGLLK